MTEFYDLAATIRNEPMERAPVHIVSSDYRATLRELSRAVGMPVSDLPLDGLFAADECATLSSHFGTHLDAPTHYGDVIEGTPAESVDEMALEPLLTHGVKVDFCDRGVSLITEQDLAEALRRMDYDLRAGDLLITHVGMGDRYDGDPGIPLLGAGMSGAAVEWLLDRGVRITATDSMTADMPIPWMEERFREGDRDAYFPVHTVGGRRRYVHVEKAYGLQRLPVATGFRVSALPIKLEGASGAWTRFSGMRALPAALDRAAIVDLSQPIRNVSMEPQVSTIEKHDRERRRRQWAKHLGVPVSEVEARGSWDLVTASTRAGTHIEAPLRFGPSCAGQDARPIDEVPLDWCFGPGVLLDVRDGRDGSGAAGIDEAEIDRALERIGHRLSPGEIVVLRTGAGERFDGDPNFAAAGRGLTRDGLLSLLYRGVTMVGTDAELLDRPLPAMVADLRRGEHESFFPVHRLAREIEHCQLLKLGNLGALEDPTGFFVWAPPIKLEHAGSGWARAVALIPR